MLLRAGQLQHVSPSATTASVVASLIVTEFHDDAWRVAIPRAEPHLVVRFGMPSGRGLDVHVLGARERAHRKHIRAGQRAVMARLHLGVDAPLLGVSPHALAGRTVALDALWGDAATERLLDRLAEAPTLAHAAAVLDRAIAERVREVRAFRPHARLVREAAARLDRSSVGAVAEALGVSERNLRRVFREAVGMGPKSFARLARFHRALNAVPHAHVGPVDWASIAVTSGYYDQAHLISDFRAIAGVTPRALLRELS